MEAENSCVVAGNRTGQAELNLMARASMRVPAEKSVVPGASLSFRPRRLAFSPMPPG
jgi:hypothetical protein